MKKMSWLIGTVSMCCLLLFASCESKQKEVTIGNVKDWTLNNTLTYLTKTVLEEAGYKVKVKDERIENIFRLMAEGKIDLYMDAWEDAHYVYIYEHQGLQDLDEIYKGCKMGIAVPRYFDVDSIGDLKRDSTLYKDQFYGVEKDAGVMIGAITAFKNYGMEPQIISMDEDDFLNQLELMYTKKDTFVTAAWKPHWMIAAFDLKFLTDTSNSFGETDEIHAYGRPDFREDNAEAAQIVSRMYLNDAELNELLTAMRGKKTQEEREEVIKTWKTKHVELVNGWLGKHN
jgi:glycine betaine/proline transport system substrate-binding protein